MTERQSTLLKNLIEKHINTAEPVASALLASDINVSSATVRNDMAELEEQGYITQPHTSAGRVPTEKGYKFFIENFLNPRNPSANTQKKLEASVKGEKPIKDLAKSLAEETHLAVMVAMANNDFYYTGLSHLFSQPEFSHHDQVLNLSAVLDTLDEVLRDLFDEVDGKLTILIGDENPFSTQSALILSQAKVDSRKQGLVAILGPTRIDYNKAAGLLDYAKMTLNKHYS